MNKTRKKINQRSCYNRIWSWSPMSCEKHGPRASVTTKTSAFGFGFCLLSPSGHVFHTAWETMIKSCNIELRRFHCACICLAEYICFSAISFVSAHAWFIFSFHESYPPLTNINLLSGRGTTPIGGRPPIGGQPPIEVRYTSIGDGLSGSRLLQENTHFSDITASVIGRNA